MTGTILLVGLAACAPGAPARAPAPSIPSPSTTVAGAGVVARGEPGAFSLLLPPTWSTSRVAYQDGYVDTWSDPGDADRKVAVTSSACSGCPYPAADAGSGAQPDPQLVQAGQVGSRVIIRPGALAFAARTPDDRYPANGILLAGPAFGAGYVLVEVWMPQTDHGLATAMLNSFHASAPR